MGGKNGLESMLLRNLEEAKPIRLLQTKLRVIVGAKHLHEKKTSRRYLFT